MSSLYSWKGTQVSQISLNHDGFEVPTDMKMISKQAHRNPPTHLPLSSSTVDEVRYFIYQILTLKSHKVVNKHPEYIYATVQNWVHVGSSFRAMDERDCRSLCPFTTKCADDFQRPILPKYRDRIGQAIWEHVSRLRKREEDEHKREELKERKNREWKAMSRGSSLLRKASLRSRMPAKPFKTNLPLRTHDQYDRQNGRLLQRARSEPSGMTPGQTRGRVDSLPHILPSRHVQWQKVDEESFTRRPRSLSIHPSMQSSVTPSILSDRTSPSSIIPPRSPESAEPSIEHLPRSHLPHLHLDTVGFRQDSGLVSPNRRETRSPIGPRISPTSPSRSHRHPVPYRRRTIPGRYRGTNIESLPPHYPAAQQHYVHPSIPPVRNSSIHEGSDTISPVQARRSISYGSQVYQPAQRTVPHREGTLECSSMSGSPRNDFPHDIMRNERPAITAQGIQQQTSPTNIDNHLISKGTSPPSVRVIPRRGAYQQPRTDPTYVPDNTQGSLYGGVVPPTMDTYMGRLTTNSHYPPSKPSAPYYHGEPYLKQVCEKSWMGTRQSPPSPLYHQPSLQRCVSLGTNPHTDIYSISNSAPPILSDTTHHRSHTPSWSGTQPRDYRGMECIPTSHLGERSYTMQADTKHDMARVEEYEVGNGVKELYLMGDRKPSVARYDRACTGRRAPLIENVPAPKKGKLFSA